MIILTDKLGFRSRAFRMFRSDFMYTIGQVSQMCGIPVSTLRYYDKEGLFPHMERVSGIRRFSDRELETLRIIDCLKKSGLEIREIRKFMQWCSEGSSSYPQRRELFENQKIRTAWDAEKEEWYFAIVDVIAVLTDSADPQNYWRVLKKRLKDEGNETITNCNGLKMTAPDGKKRKTDVANTEQLLRIIQSIPSPKAEPFKAWLAMVGKERIEETIDPEQAIDRALETYLKKGYSEDWIHQRILSIRVRNELTAEWQARGVEQGREYAILTDEITKAWSGMTTRQYKNLKGLKKENLRDNMSTLEIVLNMLAETTTTELSKAHRPEGFEESRILARRGGKVAGDARRAIEADTGRPAVTAQNAAQLNAVVTDVIEGVAEADKPNEDEK